MCVGGGCKFSEAGQPLPLGGYGKEGVLQETSVPLCVYLTISLVVGYRTTGQTRTGH